MEPVKKLHPGIVALIVIVLVGVAATAVIVINSSANKTNTSTETTQANGEESNTDTTTDSSSGTSTHQYIDGTYEATGRYSSPGGRESIDLTVTIKNGIITSTSLVTDPTGSDARDYQEAFSSAYKELIVGKSIDRVSLSRVAGSSLTSNGFNDALDQIKSDAKA